MKTNVIYVNDASFDVEVIQSSLPTLVDFWAEWCAPCRALAPLLDQIADEYTDKLKVVKMNVDESTKIPAQYFIRGIPALLIFKNGQVIGTKIGALSKSQLSNFIDTTI
jgi:thioredoxin 1